MIILVPYDPDWPAAFAAEATVLRQALGERALRIDHVGSTSVPGLSAKPVVDIQVSVRGLRGTGGLVAALASAGYQHVSLGDFDRVYPFFQKPAGWPARFHVHLCEAGGEQERRHLAFRDHLRRHPTVAADYLALKQRLAGQFSGETFESREQYSLAKSTFVEGVLALALRVPQVPGCILSPAQPADAEEWSEFEALPEFKRHTSSTVQSAADLLALIERSRSGEPAAPVYFVARSMETGQLVAAVRGRELWRREVAGREICSGEARRREVRGVGASRRVGRGRGRDQRGDLADIARCITRRCGAGGARLARRGWHWHRPAADHRSAAERRKIAAAVP